MNAHLDCFGERSLPEPERHGMYEGGRNWRMLNALKRRSNAAIIVYACLLDLIIGYIDYATGYDIGISVFYLAPIGLAVWFMNTKKTAGLSMALLASVTLTVSDLLAGKVVGFYVVELWNTLIHFAFFGISALLIYEVKASSEKRELLIDDLQKALDEVRTLSGLLPMCSSCKKIRDDLGYWKEVDVYITQHSQALISHGICPECASRLYPDFTECRTGVQSPRQGNSPELKRDKAAL